MLRYILNLKRSGRSVINPLPIDFGNMYFLYPEESGYVQGFRSTGLMKQLASRVRSVFRSDETKAYRPEKIY